MPNLQMYFSSYFFQGLSFLLVHGLACGDVARLLFCVVFKACFVWGAL